MKQTPSFLDRIYPKLKKTSAFSVEDSKRKANHLRSNLQSFAAFSTALVAISANSNDTFAAIQHSGPINIVVPNFTYNSATLAGTIGQLDLDGDGIPEINHAILKGVAACNTTSAACSVNQAQNFSAFTAPFLSFNTTTQVTAGGGTSTLYFGRFAGNYTNFPNHPNLPSFNTAAQFNTSSNINNIVATSENFFAAPALQITKKLASNGNTVSSNAYGNFLNAASAVCGFIGFTAELSSNGSTVNGWVQIEVGANAQSMRIIDFAYEDSGAAILAGDTGAGVQPATCVVPAQNIPTLSEWSLITLAILLMTFGTLYIGRREEVLAHSLQTSTSHQEYGFQWQRPPLNWGIFQKTLSGTGLLAFVAAVLTFIVYGSIAAVDVLGTAVAGPLLAYLAHLVWLFEKDKSER